MEIEDHIEEMREAVRSVQLALAVWEEAGLPRKTILVLMAHQTKLPQRTIAQVWEGFEALHEYFEAKEQGDG